MRWIQEAITRKTELVWELWEGPQNFGLDNWVNVDITHTIGNIVEEAGLAREERIWVSVGHGECSVPERLSTI